MQNPPQELNLVTLNCWGLKYISKLRRERLTEIGRQLAIASPQPHIVTLQECFTQEDYQSIRRETRFILPYGKFYHSGAFGGGLAILSRWPIEESTMHRYPLNGRPTAFWRGDWFVGKGVAWAKIRYGPATKHVVEVFNTHTHAPYEGGKPNDSYLCHRTSQSWEMAKLLRGAAERGHLILAMGDFNMIPMSPEYQLITNMAPVKDVWRILHPDSSVGPSHHPAEEARHRPVPSAEFNILENGAASDGPYNTWRWPKAQQNLLGPGKHPVAVSPDTPDPLGKRLDYIFAGSGDATALGGTWKVEQAKVGMMMRHPELGCSLSDHFSVEATLSFQPSPPSPPSEPTSNTASNHESVPTAAASATTNGTLHPPPPSEPAQTTTTTTSRPTSTPNPTSNRDSALHNGTYLQLQTPTPSQRTSTSTEAGEAHPNRPGPHPPTTTPAPPTLPIPSYDAILALITAYAAREQRQHAWRTRHFLLALAASVACLVGAWFTPRLGTTTTTTTNNTNNNNNNNNNSSSGDAAAAGAVGFVLVLVSSVWLAAGTVDGLMGLLFFGGEEMNALREFEWEVRNARGRAVLRAGGGGGEGAGGGGGGGGGVLDGGDLVGDGTVEVGGW